MQEPTFEVAVRILTAVVEKRQPAVRDVRSLRRSVPLSSDLPIDVLACDVVEQALGSRKPKHATRAGES